MKHLRIGQKNQKVELYEPIEVKSALGAQIPDEYNKKGRYWASVMQKIASETEAGDALQSVSVYSIVTSWREVSQNWLVVWRSNILRVISVDNSDPYKRETKIIAELDTSLKLEDLT